MIKFFREIISVPAWGWFMILLGVFGNGWVVGWVMRTHYEIKAQQQIKLESHIHKMPTEEFKLPES